MSKPATPAVSMLAIVGPTASGKSSLALQLSQQFDGEIIAADSRTVYRGMDIGTAKPTPAEQKLVPHHLLDVVEPGRPFTAADFQRLANIAVDDIQSRGKLPIIVGGTGLYMDAVLYNFSFAHPGDEVLRSELNTLSLQALQQRAGDAEISLNDSDWQNPRRLVRALESGDTKKTRASLAAGVKVVGLDAPPPSLLEERIRMRVDAMIRAGFVEEVRFLINKYGEDCAAFSAPGYRSLIPYIKGEVSLAQAQTNFVKRDMQLAKRQLTWFRRNPDITWFESADEAAAFVQTVLIARK
jgi:tRNA dimethylallyltransferase